MFARIWKQGLISLVLGVAFVISGCSSHFGQLTNKHTSTFENLKIQPTADDLDEATGTNTFKLSDKQNDVVGRIAKVEIQRGDTLTKIAQKYDLGYQDIMRANPDLDPKQLLIGQELLIPDMYLLPPPEKREGIVINIPELRLYDFTQKGEVSIYPVALGRQGWRTPVADTYIYRKQKKPTWYVPDSIRKHHKEKYGEELPKKVEPGPDNPLGEYAVYLRKAGYLIHGTNNPSSIGHFVSSGCIRMYADDIKHIYNHVSKGTPVHIVYLPNKVGWQGRKLYMSAYKPLEHSDGLYQVHHVSLQEALDEAKQRRAGAIKVDKDKMKAIKKLGYGIPTQIGHVGS